MLKQYSKAIFLKINAKTLEHPGSYSVLGTGHYPRNVVVMVVGAVGGGVPLSDFIRLAGMKLSLKGEWLLMTCYSTMFWGPENLLG